MLYVINDIVTFDSVNRMLVNSKNPDIEITLPNAQSLVLEMLVLNPKKTITRDEIFSKVWGDNGQQISNASLNNYISEIRKALNALNLDGIIVTLPKIGFKLNAEVKNKKNHRKRNLKIFKEFNVIIFIFFIFIFIFIFIFTKHITIIQNKNKPIAHYLYTEGLCNFYYLGDNRPENKKIMSIKEYLKSGNVQCSSQEKEIYYSTGRDLNSKFGVELITICDKDNNGMYVSCENTSRME
ncbi:helix-turn-helix domain-containing protein [Serratia liquefaciens]|uniref:winged helix-turn-helix domain-containing protein n=1 Tax=Serratia liquefaciens TaxID=614 RepID=UPI0032DF1A3D